jgi:hypothetical protein
MLLICPIHADLMGAFDLIAKDYYNLAMAMVFGSATLALSWEPFQQVIEILSDVYAYQSDLVVKPKTFGYD